MDRHFIGRSYIGHRGLVYRVTIDCDLDGKVFYSICLIGSLKDAYGPVVPENFESFAKEDQKRLVNNHPLLQLDGKQRVIPKAVAIEIMKSYRMKLFSAGALVSAQKQVIFARIMANSGTIIRSIEAFS